MFEGFDLDRLNVGEAEIMVRRGGSGPPLLLLHGNPQTHAMWHAVAPILAQHFSVVATDLRGYGDSSKPPTDARHAPYSKRTLAADQLKVMQRLGYEGFFVAGHDRGGRVAYRMALDAPTAVRKLGRAGHHSDGRGLCPHGPQGGARILAMAVHGAAL
jgi:haloacetate dehalogenase